MSDRGLRALVAFLLLLTLLSPVGVTEMFIAWFHYMMALGGFGWYDASISPTFLFTTPS